MFFKRLITHHSRFILQLGKKIHHILLPQTCILCGGLSDTSHGICHACLQDLPSLSHTCMQCAQFLMASARICGSCLQQPPPFARTYALFPYQPPIEQLIVKLKFQQQLNISKTLGILMAQAIAQIWYQQSPLPDLIIPIPLHRKRLQERGFNQAHEIAKPIAQALALPIDFTGVIRSKYTVPQSGLVAVARKQNINNAFTAYRDYTGLSLAIIDDVITTGQTVTEFSRVLKLKGAKTIDVWCCARRDKNL